MKSSGFCHVYTGDGKGKTSAAFGMAIRSAMAGNRVYIGQFVKGMKYSETKIATLLAEIEIDQYGDTCFINKEPSKDDLLRAQEGLKKIKSILESGDYQLVILDEITIALFYKLLTEEDVLDALKSRSAAVEVILTGRYCPEGLIAYADLVTEMIERKHYYTQGVTSRVGFDC